MVDEKVTSSHLSRHCYFFVTESGNALAALGIGNINEGDSNILKKNWSKVNHLLTVNLFDNSMT